MDFESTFVIELFSKETKAKEIYKKLQLGTIGNKDTVKLFLAVNKEGVSKGIAFVQVPKSQETFLTNQNCSEIRGKQIRIHKEDEKFLKHKKWVIPHGEQIITTLSKKKQLKPKFSWKDDGLEMDQSEDVSQLCFDTGCHLTHRKFKRDLDTELRECLRHGITRINIPGKYLKQCQESAAKVKIINRGNNSTTNFKLYFSAGISPHQACQWNGSETIEELEALYKMADCSSAGLIGLDYSSDCEQQSSKVQQKEAFEAQIKLACAHHKPILLVEKLAHEDMINILNLYHTSLPPCAIYCYNGTEEIIQTYISMGFYIAITGHVSKTSYQLSSRIQLALEEGIIPKSRILLASDAPYCGTQANKLKNRPIALESSLNKLPESTLPRGTPRGLFVLKDMIALGLGENKDDANMLKLLNNNYKKFFLLDEYAYTIPSAGLPATCTSSTASTTQELQTHSLLSVFKGMCGSALLAHLIVVIFAAIVYMISQLT